MLSFQSLTELYAVLGAALLAAIHAGSVAGAADDVVADTGQVADTASADKHEGVRLKVMAFTRYVGGDFVAVRKSDPRDFALSGVRLLGPHDAHEYADTALLRATSKHGAFGTVAGSSPALTDELVDCRHHRYPFTTFQYND